MMRTIHEMKMLVRKMILIFRVLTEVCHKTFQPSRATICFLTSIFVSFLFLLLTQDYIIDLSSYRMEFCAKLEYILFICYFNIKIHVVLGLNMLQN